MIIFLTGLPGSGKTTIGSALADALEWQFYDMDESFPDEYKEMNKKGELVPQELIDGYFYDTFVPDIEQKHSTGNLVVSGALARKEYLRSLRESFPDIQLLYLTAPRQVLEQRTSERAHFVSSEILEKVHGSALDVSDGLPQVSTDTSVEQVVAKCRQYAR